MSTVDVQEASRLLKAHPKTVLDLISAGAIPAAKIGRAYVMLTKDILQYVENSILKQTAKRMRKVTTSSSKAGSP